MTREWVDNDSLDALLAGSKPKMSDKAARNDFFSDLAESFGGYEKGCQDLRAKEQERTLWRGAARTGAITLGVLGWTLPLAEGAAVAIGAGLGIEGAYHFITGDSRRRMIKDCEDYYDYKKRKQEEKASALEREYDGGVTGARERQNDAWNRYAEAYERVHGSGPVRAYDNYTLSKPIIAATNAAIEAALRKAARG